MGVVLRTILSGSACRLVAWGTEESCDLFDFLKGLRRDDLNAHQRLLAFLEQCVQHGLPKNIEKCRYLREYEAFEFKTRDGVRIMAFWDEGRIVVCTHGFVKKSQKTPKKQLKRLAERKRVYFEAKRAGTLRWQEEVLHGSEKI